MYVYIIRCRDVWTSVPNSGSFALQLEAGAAGHSKLCGWPLCSAAHRKPCGSAKSPEPPPSSTPYTPALVMPSVFAPKLLLGDGCSVFQSAE